MSIDRDNTINLCADVKDYISRGWACLPVCADKIPLAGYKNISRPPSWETLQNWFDGPTANADGVAVIGGKISGGLAVRDFDDQAEYDRWAESHPVLARELPTSIGRRGPGVWCRSDLHKIQFIDGGEFRGRGITLAPHSLHKSGCRYRWLNPLPKGPLPEVPHTEFIASTASSLGLEVQNCLRDVRKPFSEVSNLSKTPGDNPLSDISNVSNLSKTLSVDEAIRLTLPERSGQRNNCILNLARALKFNCRISDVTAARGIVRRWHEQAQPIITTKMFDDTWTDFIHAFPRAKWAFGVDVLQRAADGVDPTELPTVAANYDSLPMQKLIALCHSLSQVVQKDGRFFISTYEAGERIGVDQRQAWRLLRTLETDRVIACVERGRPGTSMATRYRWIGGERGAE